MGNNWKTSVAKKLWTGLVSGLGVYQLPCVPKLSSGTGEAAVAAVHDATVAWDLNILQNQEQMLFSLSEVCLALFHKLLCPICLSA